MMSRRGNTIVRILILIVSTVSTIHACSSTSETTTPVYETTIAAIIKTTSSKECPFTKFAGDNVCDDLINNEECDWDGGDCCGYNVNTLLCSACDCLDPNHNSDHDGCIDPFDYTGDSLCDDALNNEDCEWDGGDCCGANVNTDVCSACDCLDPTFN